MTQPGRPAGVASVAFLLAKYSLRITGWSTTTCSSSIVRVLRCAVALQWVADFEQRRGACGPCYYRCSQPVAGACMRRITPHAVATQVEEILGGRQPLAPGRCRSRPTHYRGGGGAPRSASRLP